MKFKTTIMRCNAMSCPSFKTVKILLSVTYTDVSVLLGINPVVKFIRNNIRDRSGVFSISSLMRISMTSFPALHDSVCIQSCQTNVDNVLYQFTNQNLSILDLALSGATKGLS